MPTDHDETHRVGRPRSAEAHQAILDATLVLLGEEGFTGMSIEKIAERAGVGKTTIYRRWATKEELVADALVQLESTVDFKPSGDIQTDIRALTQANIAAFDTPLVGSLFPRLLGEVQTNPALFEIYYGRVLLPRFVELEKIIRDGQAQGLIRPDLDPKLVRYTIIGPLIMRLLFSAADPMPPDYLDQLLDEIWRGISPSSNP